jgi:hypothetical protein
VDKVTGRILERSVPLKVIDTVVDSASLALPNAAVFYLANLMVGGRNEEVGGQYISPERYMRLLTGQIWFHTLCQAPIATIQGILLKATDDASVAYRRIVKGLTDFAKTRGLSKDAYHYWYGSQSTNYLKAESLIKILNRHIIDAPKAKKKDFVTVTDLSQVPIGKSCQLKIIPQSYFKPPFSRTDSQGAIDGKITGPCFFFANLTVDLQTTEASEIRGIRGDTPISILAEDEKGRKVVIEGMDEMGLFDHYTHQAMKADFRFVPNKRINYARERFRQLNSDALYAVCTPIIEGRTKETVTIYGVKSGSDAMPRLEIIGFESPRVHNGAALLKEYNTHTIRTNMLTSLGKVIKLPLQPLGSAIESQARQKLPATIEKS